jgi:hypothetical protein
VSICVDARELEFATGNGGAVLPPDVKLAVPVGPAVDVVTFRELDPMELDPMDTGAVAEVSELDGACGVRV